MQCGGGKGGWGGCSLELREIAAVAIISGTGENRLKWVRRDIGVKRGTLLTDD